MREGCSEPQMLEVAGVNGYMRHTTDYNVQRNLQTILIDDESLTLEMSSIRTTATSSEPNEVRTSFTALKYH